MPDSYRHPNGAESSPRHEGRVSAKTFLSGLRFGHSRALVHASDDAVGGTVQIHTAVVGGRDTYFGFIPGFKPGLEPECPLGFLEANATS